MVFKEETIGFMVGIDKPFNVHQGRHDKGHAEYIQNSYWYIQGNIGKWYLAKVKLLGEDFKPYPLYKIAKLKISGYDDGKKTKTVKFTAPPENFYSKYVTKREILDHMFDEHKLVDDPVKLKNDLGFIQREIKDMKIIKKRSILVTTTDNLEIWFPSKLNFDIDTSPDNVIFTISTYEKKDSSLGIKGLGYWTEEKYRLW